VPELTALTFSPIFERALLYAAIAIATLVAFTNWRRGDARAFREPLIAFFALWFVEGALLVSTAAPALLPPALVQGLDFAAIVLLAWGFLASSLSPRAGGILLGGGLTLATAFSVFSFSIMRLAGSQPAWIDMAWSIGSLVVSASATLALGLRRSPDRTSGSIAAFAALALSAALDLLSLPDLSRVCVLVAFILFPLGLYQRALSDLRSIHETLREFSQSALKQTQELVTLLEASTYLFTSFDLDELSRKVVEHAALGIDADRAVIILTDPAAPQTLRVSSSYPRGSVGTGQTFLLNTQPALTLAMTSGDPLRIGPRGQGAAQLMRLLDIGPAERCQNRQRRMRQERVRIAVVDAAFEVEIDDCIGCAVLELHAAQEDVLGRELTLARRQRRQGRRAIDFDELEDVILDRGYERIPGRLEPEPVLVLELVGDKGTAALLTMHEPFVLKQFYRLADGDTRDFEFPFKPFES